MYSTINMVFEDRNGRQFGVAFLHYTHISQLAQMVDELHLMRQFGCRYITAYVVIDEEQR